MVERPCAWMVPLDGTQDRPGKTAQNWSRRDNIRAGAVSGPWRSAPRAGGEAPAAPAVTPGPAPTRQAEAVAPTRVVAQTRAAGVGGQEAVTDRPAAGGQRVGQTRRVALWIGAGVLVAFAIVGAAVLLRPGGDPEAVAPAGSEDAVEPAAVAPDKAPEAEAAQASGTGTGAALADPALAGVSSVRLRVGPEVTAGQQEAIVGALKGAGVDEVVVESLPFKIATSRVGYYRAADEPAAEALARVASPLIGDGAAIGVRDYGKLLTDPQPGRLDLWIGG